MGEIRIVAACGSAGCNAEAQFEVFWPGKTVKMCDVCADRAIKIAGAMGFPLDVRPLREMEILRVMAAAPPVEGRDYYPVSEIVAKIGGKVE